MTVVYSPPLESGWLCDLFSPLEHSKVTLCVFQIWGLKESCKPLFSFLGTLLLPGKEAWDRRQWMRDPPGRSLLRTQHQGPPTTRVRSSEALQPQPGKASDDHSLLSRSSYDQKTAQPSPPKRHNHEQVAPALATPPWGG